MLAKIDLISNNLQILQYQKIRNLCQQVFNQQFVVLTCIQLMIEEIENRSLALKKFSISQKRSFKLANLHR